MTPNIDGIGARPFSTWRREAKEHRGPKDIRSTFNFPLSILADVAGFHSVHLFNDADALNY